VVITKVCNQSVDILARLVVLFDIFRLIILDIYMMMMILKTYLKRLTHVIFSQ